MPCPMGLVGCFAHSLRRDRAGLSRAAASHLEFGSSAVIVRPLFGTLGFHNVRGCTAVTYIDASATRCTKVTYPKGKLREMMGLHPRVH